MLKREPYRLSLVLLLLSHVHVLLTLVVDLINVVVLLAYGVLKSLVLVLLRL